VGVWFLSASGDDEEHHRGYGSANTMARLCAQPTQCAIFGFCALLSDVGLYDGPTSDRAKSGSAARRSCGVITGLGDIPRTATETSTNGFLANQKVRLPESSFCRHRPGGQVAFAAHIRRHGVGIEAAGYAPIIAKIRRGCDIRSACGIRPARPPRRVPGCRRSCPHRCGHRHVGLPSG
jgi:hypothetical protein